MQTSEPIISRLKLKKNGGGRVPLTIAFEIMEWLDEVGEPDLVADRLIQKIEKNSDYFNDYVLNELYSFLFIGGFYPTIIEFIGRHMGKKNFKIPWSLLVECFCLCEGISEDAKKALWESIKINQVEVESSMAPHSLELFPDLAPYKIEIKNLLLEKYQAVKNEMIDSLVSLRAQQLVDAERQLLTKLCKMYPDDPEVLNQLSIYKENNAYEILTRYSPDHRIMNRDQIFVRLGHFLEIKEEFNEEMAKKILKQMIPLAEGDAILAYEFAVALLIIEDYEGALHILEYAENHKNKKWLRIELLLLQRHFLVVLEELVGLELEFSDEPETFFAISYFRAQAYWGLGQKGNAVEIMESLTSLRPNYRSALTLLGEWRGR